MFQGFLNLINFFKSRGNCQIFFIVVEMVKMGMKMVISRICSNSGQRKRSTRLLLLIVRCAFWEMANPNLVGSYPGRVKPKSKIDARHFLARRSAVLDWLSVTVRIK